MRFVIDRFEDQLVVVESVEGELINIPRAIVPIEARESDVLIISIDKEKTEEKEIRIKEKFNRLLSR